MKARKLLSFGLLALILIVSACSPAAQAPVATAPAKDAEPAAATNTTLLVSNIDSRETTSNFSPKPTLGARQANNNNAPPITITKYNRINTPRRGSVANACTEVSTPERTKNVPNRLNEKAQIESNTVQTLNASRFSVTASE